MAKNKRSNEEIVSGILEKQALTEGYQLLGVDIAPGKESTISYLTKDGEVRCEDLEAATIQVLLKEYGKSKKKTLLIWDAPLTGVPLEKINQKTPLVRGDCTMRAIERKSSHLIFNDGILGKKEGLPKGVSVQGYAGCQHWTITKHLLGLPIMGPYCKTDIPFKHIADQSTKLGTHNVIEAHPALAMYLLLKEKVDNNWFLYKHRKCKEVTEKTKKEITEKLFSSLLDYVSVEKIEGIGGIKFAGSKENSDHLDAFVCWLLGVLFLTKSDQLPVQIIGDANTGSFLLPITKDHVTSTSAK